MEKTNHKKVLIVVDMVNGFITSGNMADEAISHIIPECERLVKLFMDRGNEVVFIKDSHESNCAEFNKFPTHCVIGTYEAELVDALKKYESKATTFCKNSTSAMFAPGFLNWLSKLREVDEVVIIGCCTDICVMNLAIPMQNYFDQENCPVKVVVPKNAVETYDSPQHNRDEYNTMAFKFLNQAGIIVRETL